MVFILSGVFKLILLKLPFHCRFYLLLPRPALMFVRTNLGSVFVVIKLK